MFILEGGILMAFNPIACGMCIAKVAKKFSRYAPQSVIRECVWETVRNGKDGRSFQRSLRREIVDRCRDAAHADRIAKSVWNELKGKCKG